MKLERRFRWVAYAEGTSFLVLLLIAMPLKYWLGLPLPNRVVGLLHGVLFVIYVVQLCELFGEGRFTLRITLLGLLASLLPFGPFWFERRYGAHEDRARSA